MCTDNTGLKIHGDPITSTVARKPLPAALPRLELAKAWRQQSCITAHTLAKSGDCNGESLRCNSPHHLSRKDPHVEIHQFLGLQCPQLYSLVCVPLA